MKKCSRFQPIRSTGVFHVYHYLSILLTVRIFFLTMVRYASRALLGFSFIGLLRQYLTHFYDSFLWSVTLVSCALSGFSFIGLLCQFRAHIQYTPSFESYVNISCILESTYIRLLRQFLAHFWDSLSLDCCVSVSRTFRILIHWFVTLVSCALLGLSYMRLLVSTTRRIGLGLLR